MTITEQITSQIDALVESIKSYSDAVQAENQRAAKAKADSKARYELQKSKIRQETDARVQNVRNVLQTSEYAINTSLSEIAAFEQELNRLVPRSSLSSIPAVSDKFSAADAQALIAKIKEKGFWAWLKKLLSICNYSSNQNMASELYGKIDNAHVYYNRALSAAQKKCQNGIDACKQEAQKKLNTVERQYQQDVQVENNTHTAKVQALARQEHKIATDPRFRTVQQMLNKAADVLGAKDPGWQNYMPAKTIAEDLLLGVILYPCKISNPTADASRLLKLFASYNPTVNGFSVPLTVPATKPVMLYADCETSDIKMAASIFQSVVARMIRFMPPKSVRSVFFDPVNRGTSLGSLIHLSGEGTSQACMYHLSPQDINLQMGKLTEHVDKICNRLTGSGCTDINAYNAIPKVPNIPYTAVIIHDYPNGFDSTSLGNLQVLINKAKQCGLSIMISCKQGDKIEHKALEIHNLITQNFSRIRIMPQAKAQITMGTATYSFRPTTVNISDAFFREINKVFTYKAPLENGFAKFFGGKQPEYRSAKKGLDIPFAVDAQGNVIDLKIGYDLSAYGLMSGGVGSGKTTLLHMLITSAAMHYHPSDLELWLVDHKVAEFAFYRNYCPPHVRYVVADDSDEISYSVMDEITAELNRRKQAFLNAHTKDFVAYRESTYGKAHNLPRILVIIDEFHRMAQAAQEDTNYKRDLENIFSEARSHGVSLLLCDQQVSNGLNGLSPKSRDLINVRIALRNKVDEIREVLAVENALATEDVKKQILDTSAGIQGSLIYKHEVEKDAFTNAVVFKSCRAIYATEPDRIRIIGELRQKYAGFDREKTFFIGAARQYADTQQIKRYEAQYPQKSFEGDRFYIGTPMGIQPCFFFSLKNGESGENILLAGSDHEKRISILKSVVNNAKRYGYAVRFFASKASALYRQNRDVLDSLAGAKMVTSFPEICRYIGERANQLKQLYSEDEDTDLEFNCKNREIAVFIGLDELYGQMEASPYNQKTAWTVKEKHAVAKPGNASTGTTITPVTTPVVTSDGEKTIGTVPQQSNSELTDSIVNINAMLASLAADQAEEEPAPAVNSELADSILDINAMLASLAADQAEEEPAPAVNSELAASMADINAMLASLEADAGSAMTMQLREKFAGPADSGIKGYNAVQDLATLVADGWKIGISTMVVVDRGTVFSKMRQMKLDGNFNHRIAMVMSPDEAQGFMSKTKTMKSLIEANDQISAVYEYMGGREQCFRPYLYD